MNLSRLAVLALVAVPLAASAGGPRKWEKVTSTDGIDVWARDVEGTPVKEMKATGVIPAPPEKVLAVLADLEAYTETMPHTKVARVVKRKGDTAWFYTVIDAPVVSNRDYCIKITNERLPDGRLKCSWVPANELAPEKSAGVRVETNKGYWLLEAVDGGEATQAEYYLFTDPGGSLPKWLVNKANSSAVPDVFRAIRKMVKSPRYANARSPLQADAKKVQPAAVKGDGAE